VQRFATEQIRRQTYQLAGTIRTEYYERLRAGEAAADLETELERRILKVSAEQIQRALLNVPRAPAPVRA
jgi:predicted transcriptional regulator